MSVPDIRFLALAEVEIDEAADWYATQDDGDQLADDFLAEVDRVAGLVRERPRAWTEIEPGVRRVVLRRFPYALIYVLRPPLCCRNLVELGPTRAVHSKQHS